jgi:hypothetical protein
MFPVTVAPLAGDVMLIVGANVSTWISWLWSPDVA